MNLTSVVMEAANVAGLSFEDHIIIGPAGRFSFYEEKLLVPVTESDLKTKLKNTRRKTR